MFSFILLTLLYVRFLALLIPEGSRAWGFSIIFIASLVIAFFAYRVLIKYIFSKYQIEKYMDPLFASRYKKKKVEEK
jgi:hypothetical protein